MFLMYSLSVLFSRFLLCCWWSCRSLAVRKSDFSAWKLFSSTVSNFTDWCVLPPQVSALKYHTKAISTFHQINAFEEDGFLMLDLCCADDGGAINNYLIQNLRKSGEALNEVKESLTQGFAPACRATCKMQTYCILSLRFCLQVYDSLCRPYPRRFVLPLHVSDETTTGQNLNTRPSSQATCVKVSRDKASQHGTLSRQSSTVQLFHGSLFQSQWSCCIVGC